MKRLVNAILVALLVIASLILAACGGDDDDEETPTTAAIGATATTPALSGSTATSATTMSASDDEAAVGEVADTIVTVIVARDRERLRDFTSGSLQQRLRDQDIDRLMDCVPEGASIGPVSRTVTIEGDTATVVVTLEVTTADGTVSTVERTWLFERADDGAWALAELPECPFEP